VELEKALHFTDIVIRKRPGSIIVKTHLIRDRYFLANKLLLLEKTFNLVSEA
jgi:hypothetical protein